MSTKLYAQCQKITVGPGGMQCACCSPFGVAPRKSKPLMRRILRRKLKRDLSRETY